MIFRLASHNASCGMTMQKEQKPVGYLEGIFIKEGYQNKGYAKELLAECEVWAKGNGCQ